MKDITLISCSYNTPKVTENMLKSFLGLHPNVEVLICENSTDDITENILKSSNIPYIRNKGGVHGESVDLLLSKVKTTNALLVDTDVIFLKDHTKIYDMFNELDISLMGEIVGDRGGKRLHKRVHPWHCFINVKNIKEKNIKFFDIDKMRSRNEIRYDVGSSFFEDVKKSGLKIGSFCGGGTFYKHYEGMSWRVQKYSENRSVHDDIDTVPNAVHNELGLKNYGLHIQQIYDAETKHMNNTKLLYKKKFVTSKLQGGLGNYLFQIACGYALSLRDNKNFACFLDLIHQGHSNVNLYFDNIFRNINFLEKEILCDSYNEPYFHYKQITNTDNSIKLDGYFQSEKYFSDFSEEIKKLFSIDQQTENFLQQKYKNIIDNSKTCSIHVRRGDYLNVGDYHPTQTQEYYNKAINFFDKEETIFVIFSDDINWCKQTFESLPNKIFIEGNKDFQDLYLMSKCANNIIANSSFSWWGAWLNQNKNKKVIAPKKWFGPALENHNTHDLYLEEWITI